jgi:CRISPR/Cas system-associated exonuclease Cas4 (RecB family)
VKANGDRIQLKYGPYSHSKIETHKKCNAKFKFAYVEGLKGERQPNKYMERGLEIHKSVELFVKGEGDLHPDIKEKYAQYFFYLKENYDCLPEQKFMLTSDLSFPVVLTESYDWDRSIFRGYYDLKIMGEGVTIDEYKTGNIYPEHDAQRLRYGTAALVQHPEIDSVIVRTVYLDRVDMRETTYTRANMEDYAESLRRAIMNCENDTLFSPMPSFQCRSCEFSRHNGGPCQF